MKALYIVALVLIVISLPARASRWVPLIKNENNGDVVLINIDSIAKHGKFTKAWFRSDFGELQAMSGLAKKYKTILSLMYFDCAGKTWDTAQGLYYSGAHGTGELVGSFSDPVDQLEFKDVAPDTFIEAEFNAVCMK